MKFKKQKNAKPLLDFIGGTRREFTSDSWRRYLFFDRFFFLVMTTKNICNDWMMVGGHCHYAKDLYWFSNDYKQINPIKIDGEHNVIGMGTVELIVRCSTKNFSTQTLKLRNVLHIPDAPCNGFEFKTMFNNIKETEGKCYCYDETKRQVCYGVMLTCGFPKLILNESIGISYMSGTRDAFLSIWLRKKEMMHLFGTSYPFYSLN